MVSSTIKWKLSLTLILLALFGGFNRLNFCIITVSAQTNQVPVADAGGPYSGTEGVAISFDGSNSTDPDGTIVSYLWDFGDGENSTIQNPNHLYNQNGTYTVTLTVSDDDGLSDTITTEVTVVEAAE